MTQSPLVTVGIPTYNRPQGLEETLRRITRQTYRNLDIFISDNHSQDEAAVRAVIEKFKGDSRIRYVRQTRNIGALPNFRFLVDNAKGDFFVFAADDDLLDEDYISAMADVLFKNPRAVVAMTGHDVEDQMEVPHIKKDYTRYLLELPHPNLYERLKRYVMQPEYYGKIRILWGLTKTKALRESFASSFAALEPSWPVHFSVMPIEFWLLTHGELEVVPRTLFHGFLLPTSEGRREGGLYANAEIIACRRSFAALRKVIMGAAALTESERRRLLRMVRFQELHALARVAPFYTLKRYSPGLARVIKKVWFEILVRN